MSPAVQLSQGAALEASDVRARPTPRTGLSAPRIGCPGMPDTSVRTCVREAARVRERVLR